MTGTASLTIRHAENRIWGRHVFLEASGDPEAIRDAYAREAPSWPRRHFALVEPTPEALDPWYRLGFAQMHAYGERESGAERSRASGIAATMNLASTAVLPEEQGHGVGRALTSHALAFARESGYANAATNWRVTNLVASRFWPALGFHVTKLRLTRELPQ